MRLFIAFYLLYYLHHEQTQLTHKSVIKCTNLLEISHRLDHKNLYTTLRTYAHYIPELKNSIPNRLEELWSTLQ
ncbi:hypothetical protein ERAQ111492_08570 [Erysipelothrix aquatica]